MKLKKLNARGFSHEVVAIAFVAIFAIAGVAYLVASHADSPQASTAAARYKFTVYSTIGDGYTFTSYSSAHPCKVHIGNRYYYDYPTRMGGCPVETRTIAVDPSVIPLGSWVCIDKYWSRRAEDTGGAVHGRHIDLYYKVLPKAWGVRYGTVTRGKCHY